ncbi:Metallo-dependent phosphatase-like protein [Obelidium mucronatum]|nr:Metallo-dependent phosphatase-like protein [Obelidium mucronatum]
MITIVLVLISCIIATMSEATSHRRIVAVGDIHGDFPQASRVFQMAQLLDENNQWIAPPSTTFVQVGDVVDRGPDTIKLFQLFQRIHNESKTAIGPYSEIYPLLGNHEIMNLSGDLRSVSQADYDSFGGRENRAYAFSDKGWIGNLLINTLNNMTIALDGTVFVHGGIKPHWASVGIEGMNQEVRQAMSEKNWNHPIFARDGPLWYRGFANSTDSTICNELDDALSILKAKRMVIGHTPQLQTGEILSRCNGKVFVIDVGITTRYGANCAALEIVGDTITALYCINGKPNEARRVDMTPSNTGHIDL